MDVERISIEEAGHRLNIMGIAGVRFFDHNPDLVGSITYIKPSEHDIHFTCVDGPEYIPHRCRLATCIVAPLVDGRPAWDLGFSIPSLLEEFNAAR